MKKTLALEATKDGERATVEFQGERLRLVKSILVEKDGVFELTQEWEPAFWRPTDLTGFVNITPQHVALPVWGYR
jgi:hypothetical protein